MARLCRLAQRLAVAAAAAAAATACAKPEPGAEKTVLMASATEVVVVLPMNVTTPLPESLEAAAPALWQHLRRYLEAHDARLKTVAFSAARTLWVESVREARGASPRASFPDAARRLVAKLSQHSDFGTLIVPSLFVQGAVVSGREASWDGAEQEVRIDEGAWTGEVGEETAFGGAVPAASLHVAVLDAEGEVVHERQAGLALLSGVRLTGRPALGQPGFEVEPLPEPFADHDALLRGIARALDPFLTPLAPDAVPR